MYVYTDISHSDHKGFTFFILETTGSEIDNFNLTLERMNEKDVLWFEIAMNDTLFP